jgi:HAE1 family hydrophobic/amphiphilic exporter-1
LGVVGGLAFSQLVTLYVTPVFYTYLDKVQRRFGRPLKSPGHPKKSKVAVAVGAEPYPSR